MLNFCKGDTVFVPAQSMRLKFHGKSTIAQRNLLMKKE